MEGVGVGDGVSQPHITDEVQRGCERLPGENVSLNWMC